MNFRGRSRVEVEFIKSKVAQKCDTITQYTRHKTKKIKFKPIIFNLVHTKRMNSEGIRDLTFMT